MKNILVVEDEPHLSTIIKLFLQRSNFCVETVLNGRQALDSIIHNMPDLLITDLQMPVMNGMELCEIIDREYPQLQQLIILMTTRTDSDIRTWLEPFQYIELMEKPLSMRRLTARINEHFANLPEFNK